MFVIGWSCARHVNKDIKAGHSKGLPENGGRFKQGNDLVNTSFVLTFSPAGLQNFQTQETFSLSSISLAATVCFSRSSNAFECEWLNGVD